MGLSTLVTTLLLVSLTPAMAKPYVLKCTTSDGQPSADLTIDLDQRVMTWGKTPSYIIIKITDRYITAIENQNVITTDVGDEIWVLDRVSGDYKRATIGMYCNDASCNTGKHLDVGKYFGRCVRPMF